MRAALAAALLTACAPTASFAWIGEVVGVHDGDTITVLDVTKAQHKVRLASVDAPELGQPYGDKAKQALSGLVFGKTVEVEPETTDRYGRTVATIRADGTDVNRELVREGAAWAYLQYLRDPSLVGVQDEAKAEQRGLWALQRDQVMPPWEWRHGRHKQVAEVATSSVLPTMTLAATVSLQCGAKRTCGQMSSCEEARFYLSQCGLSRLDGDHDGVPCEKICN